MKHQQFSKFPINAGIPCETQKCRCGCEWRGQTTCSAPEIDKPQSMHMEEIFDGDRCSGVSIADVGCGGGVEIVTASCGGGSPDMGSGSANAPPAQAHECTHTQSHLSTFGQDVLIVCYYACMILCAWMLSRSQITRKYNHLFPHCMLSYYTHFLCSAAGTQPLPLSARRSIAHRDQQRGHGQHLHIAFRQVKASH